MKNVTYILTILLTIMCHLTHGQKRSAIRMESNVTSPDLQGISPYTKGELSTILSLPVDKALKLKSNTQNRLNNLGAPTRYSKSSLLVDNKAVILCTDKKPDSTEMKNTVIVNHTEEWVISDNQGGDWYLKDKVITYTPEDIAVNHYPISGNKISLPVNSGEFYQGVIWYKTDLNPTENVPMNIQKTSAIKKYAPYLIPLAIGAVTLANQPNTSHDGVKKNNFLPMAGLNVAGVLATVGILNHQKKKQRAMIEGEFKAVKNVQAVNKSDMTNELIVPTMVLEVYSTDGKLISKTTQSLVHIGEDWQATQVAQTIPNLPKGKGNMIVSIEGISSSSTFRQQGFSVKQVFQNNIMPSSNTLRGSEYQMGQNMLNSQGEKLNSAIAQSLIGESQNNSGLNLSSISNISNNFKIDNPLNGISLANVKNNFTTKIETAVQGFQIGNIVESNIQGVQDLDVKLMDAIGDVAISLKAKATQTIQEKAQKVINIEDLNVDVFDMKNNVNIGNIQENVKNLDNIDATSITNRYLPILKKWAKDKGYEKLNINNKAINLLQEKLSNTEISILSDNNKIH